MVVRGDAPMWRHTRKSDKHVTVIIDLAPVRHATGPSRLPTMLERRSKKALKDCLTHRDHPWPNSTEAVTTESSPGSRPQPHPGI